MPGWYNLVGDGKGYDGEHSMVDDLREHALDEKSSEQPEKEKFSPIGGGLRERPQDVLPNGSVAFSKLRSDRLKRIRVLDGMPQAKLSAEIIDFDRGFAVAETKTIYAEPEVGAPLLVGYNGDTAPHECKRYELAVNYDSFSKPRTHEELNELFTMTTATTAAVRITNVEGPQVMGQIVDPGITPIKGNIVRAAVNPDGQTGRVKPGLNRSNIKPVEQQTGYDIEWDGVADTSTVEAELTMHGTESPISARLVDGSI